MPRATISQREAHRLKKRVEALEEMHDRMQNAYITDWPGPGVNIATGTDQTAANAVKVARLLGHSVVVVSDGPTLRYYGVKF